MQHVIVYRLSVNIEFYFFAVRRNLDKIIGDSRFVDVVLLLIVAVIRHTEIIDYDVSVRCAVVFCVHLRIYYRYRKQNIRTHRHSAGIRFLIPSEHALDVAVNGFVFRAYRAYVCVDEGERNLSVIGSSGNVAEIVIEVGIVTFQLFEHASAALDEIQRAAVVILAVG